MTTPAALCVVRFAEAHRWFRMGQWIYLSAKEWVPLKSVGASN